ncbi:MAG: phenylalanine--tRNA ligase subunit beta [Gammaproteobacteria bacterium]|nr:phenylalanine--tRNA ligase subunit beta [Gammaproteobacteria bacterium]
MRVSEQWLRDWVRAPLSGEALAEQLTRAGLEVDGVESAGEVPGGVLVAEIVECTQHPDADRLRVCQVSTGAGDLHQIVCGAPNARKGLKAPLALPGTQLPNGSTIGKASLRGVESAGMLCSAPEVGLGDDADGLIELPADAPVGTPLSEYLRLDDSIIDIDLTPNRGDCLSVLGVAREVSVLNAVDLDGPQIAPVPAACDAVFDVHLDAVSDCPRYVGRVVRGIDPSARTPLWMVERLRRAGSRSLGPVIDITNYVMLELGQPMHAFDLDQLEGAIHVRRAAEGESIELLDGSVQALVGESLVIADAAKAVALAGIMGGAGTAVSDSTRNVFFECAWFDPNRIRVEARRLGLHTDASHRFERNVCPDGQMRAVERATALLLEIAGGEAGPLVDTHDDACLPKQPSIRLRPSRIVRILGQAVTAPRVEDILTRLGMQVARDDADWLVVPPSYRPDIALEVDLIEEIARIEGFDSFADAAPIGDLRMFARPEEQVSQRHLRDLLIARGYQETITYSFVDSRLQSSLFPGQVSVALSNPISSEMDVMRVSLWPGLLSALLYNQHRQQGRVKLFEYGRVFPAPADEHGQPRRLAALSYGPRYERHWDLPAAAVDFFDLKADVMAMLHRVPGEVRFEPLDVESLHPGQAARIYIDERACGMIGMLHPAQVRQLKLNHVPALVELDFDAITTARVPQFNAVSRFPSVRRDVALVVDEQISAQALRNAVAQAGIDVLQELELFDLYRGEGIDSGKKSLALGLTFQAPSRTLEDREVDAAKNKIVDTLAAVLGATLRG